jgi:hypothetical protein
VRFDGIDRIGSSRRQEAASIGGNKHPDQTYHHHFSGESHL